ncbi:Pkinase-domain-containing protein [Cystobasidium minutum MCA 4210]|uniref:Pkinase-domain-containing protein n=1 Tax=Cystobasidium minutum MCA 4210 TaxID=1397322 RepID=UPI0034CDBC16|eukprot:jgi/Rhomi1/144007/e_gw1.4.1344.1
MDNASPAQDQPESAPQTPGQGVDAPAQDVTQSAQPSPAPSESTSGKQPDPASQPAPESSVNATPSAQEQAASQPPPRIVSSELYERLAQVGEGTYGKVYKARRQDTGKLVALKRIRMEAEKDGFPVTAIREIKLLQSLDHPNVLKLMEMMVSKGHVYMVSEYLEHDLTGILNNPHMQSNKFTDANLKSLMQQLLAGLDYIHWRGVLHRDLKGSNILLGRNGDLKIADFGLAKFYDKRVRNDYTNRVITLWYKPPELLFGETVYGPEVDMWSAGCIFLELFTKKPVFQGQDELHQLDVIFRYMGTPSTDTWPEVTSLPWYELVKPKHSAPSQFRETFAGTYLKSPLAIQLAEALLSFNPAKRPTAAEALTMPYFTSDDEPKAEKPTWLADIKGDWHEMESKEANKRKGREARKAAHQEKQQQQQQKVQQQQEAQAQAQQQIRT